MSEGRTRGRRGHGGPDRGPGDERRSNGADDAPAPIENGSQEAAGEVAVAEADRNEDHAVDLNSLYKMGSTPLTTADRKSVV